MTAVASPSRDQVVDLLGDKVLVDLGLAVAAVSARRKNTGQLALLRPPGDGLGVDTEACGDLSRRQVVRRVVLGLATLLTALAVAHLGSPPETCANGMPAL